LHDDAKVRLATVKWLRKIPADPAPVVRALVPLLADVNPEVREEAAATLEKVDRGWLQSRSAREAVKDLRGILARGNVLQQVEAAKVLGKIGPDAVVAVEALVVLLTDSDRDVQPEAETALARIGAAAVDALVKRLGDTRDGMRQAAARTLGKIGPDARPATAKLVFRLCDAEAEVRTAVEKALDRIDRNWKGSRGAKAAVAALADRLYQQRESNREIRRAAAVALGKLGPTAIDAVPDLIACDRDISRSVQQAAKEALEKIVKD
jgi:HEAT repeat protein